MTRWRKKLEEVKNKEIYVPNAINWEWLGQVRYEEELAPFVVKTFVHNGVSFTCDRCNQLFHIQEPVFQ